jgi:hypothetical protein
MLQQISQLRGIQLVEWEILKSNLKNSQKVRRFLESCVNAKRLQSLDEAIGTIVTLTAATLALLALIVLEFQVFLAFVTIITTLFFWVSYRIAKILHSIEIRIMIISCFFTFLFWFIFFGPIMVISRGLDEYIGTLFMIIYSFAGITLISLFCTKASDRIWRWLSLDVLDGWSPLGLIVLNTEDDKTNDSGFLIFMIVLVYGMYVLVLLIGGVEYIIITGPMFIIFLFILRSSWSKVYEIWLKSLENMLLSS